MGRYFEDEFGNVWFWSMTFNEWVYMDEAEDYWDETYSFIDSIPVLEE